MANNDRLQQIIFNIQVLNDLTVNMKDSELYPVSFFSQAFDLMQKIQNDFHTLETDQVELFASQMKKHQALILSIHRQMRQMEEAPSEISGSPAKVPAPDVSDAKQKSSEDPAVSKKENVAGQQKNKQKKVSFLSRLGIYKESADTENPPDPIVAPAISEIPPVKKQPDTGTPKTATKIIETMTRPPVTKRPPKPAPLKEIPTGNIPDQDHKAASATTDIPVSVRKMTTGTAQSQKSTITIPEALGEKTVIRTTGTATKTLAGTSRMPAPETGKGSIGIPAEGSAPPSVNDAMEKRNLSDLRKAFSLNDRFRYLRELFGGNEEVMNKVITVLNNKVSYKESILFLEEKLHWDLSNPTVKDFIKILEIRFL